MALTSPPREQPTVGGGRPLPSPGAKVCLSSADWIPRNLDRRIKQLVPIENPTVHGQVLDEIMLATLRNNLQSWYLQADRTYLRNEASDDPFKAHRYFMSSPSRSGQWSGPKDQPLKVTPKTPT